MDHLKGLFWHPGGAHDPEDYPRSISPFPGGWDYYALSFTISPHQTDPDLYWIELSILYRNRWIFPFPYYETDSVRECYFKSRTTDWPWPPGIYPPYPGYPIIDLPPNFGKPRCPEQAGNPVNLGTGNKFQQEADFSTRTPGPELAFRRFYNSQSTYNGPLGYGWTHNYNLFIEDEGDRVVVWDADGKALYFKKEGGGSFTAEPLVYDSLTQEGGGTGDCVLTRKNNTTYRFNSQGRLISIKDLNDNQITLIYSGGLLMRVSNNFGKAITLTHKNGRIETVSDPMGNTYTFTYTGDNLTGMAAPDGISTQYLYEDPHDPHNLTQKKMEEQTVGLWGYDEHDRATYSSKAGGVEAISVTYGGDPNTFEALQVTVTDSRTHEQTYQFWSLYGIPRVQQIEGSGCSSCGGKDKSYDYDKETFALVQIIDRKGTVTEFTRAAWGNIGTKKEALGTARERVTTFTYHPTYNLVETITVESVANPGQNKVTRFSYDPKGNPDTKTVNGYIGTTQYEYITDYDHNSFGQLTLVDGPRADVNDSTTYTYYEGTGDLSSMTQPHVGKTYFSDYDQNGNVGTVTDPNGVATSYTYDERNRIKTITHWDQSYVTQYFYDPLGTIDYVVLPEGNRIDYTYDAAGRLERVEDDLGNAIIYGYDTESNKTREEIRDPEGVLTKYLDFEYDAENRLWKITNPDSNFTEFDYDGNGNRKWMKDPRGNTTDYDYDELNRLRVVTQHVSSSMLNTIYAYDAHDNMRSIEDANLNTTFYIYDDFGRVTEITSPDTGTTTYRHDEAGNVIEKIDNKSITVDYTYDALNRLTAIEFPDPSQDITYSYDSPSVSYGKGRLTGMADPTGTYTYHYGPRGNLIKEEKLIGGITYTTEYSYDMNNSLRSITYPSRRIVTYVLDRVGRVSEVRTTFEGTTRTLASNIKYLPYGGITELTYGNGLVRTQGYDFQYRTASIQTGSVLNFSYIPDPNGNFTSITDYLDPSRSQSFGYDDLNRLRYASGIYGHIRYTYDFVGNRETKTVGGQTYTYIYEPNTNKLDEITGANPVDVGHDPNGNIVTMGSKSFTYNQNNRLIEASVGGETVARYFYNGLGQRIGVKRPGEVTRVYHYDLQGRLIAETTPGGNTLRQHIYVGDRPLAEEKGGYFGYVHTDHLGTPLKMTSGSKTVVWRADYKPFGEAEVDEDPDGDGKKVTMNLRFPGQYFDKETRLHYNYYRYYHSDIGRYLRPDPSLTISGDINVPFLFHSQLENPQGLSLFVYVQNNPVNLIDPKGLTDIPPNLYGEIIKELLQYAIDKAIGGVTGAACASRYCRRKAIPTNWSTGAFAECTSIFSDYDIPGGVAGSADWVITCADECMNITHRKEFKDICCIK